MMKKILYLNNIVDKEIGHEIIKKIIVALIGILFIIHRLFFIRFGSATILFRSDIIRLYKFDLRHHNDDIGSIHCSNSKVIQVRIYEKKTDLKSIENLCDPRISSFSIFEHWSDRGRFCSSWINIFDCRDVDNGSRKQKSRYLFVCSQSCDSRDPFRFSMGRASTCIILKDVSITL